MPYNFKFPLKFFKLVYCGERLRIMAMGNRNKLAPDVMNVCNMGMHRHVNSSNVQNSVVPVSYTHLDVYKRQLLG